MEPECLIHLKGGSLNFLADHNIALGVHGDYEQIETHNQVPDLSTGPVLADCLVKDCHLLSSVLRCRVTPSLPQP